MTLKCGNEIENIVLTSENKSILLSLATMTIKKLYFEVL